MAGEGEVLIGCWNEPVGRPPPPTSTTVQASTVVSTRTLWAGLSQDAPSAVTSIVAIEMEGPSALAPLPSSQSAARTVCPIVRAKDTTNVAGRAGSTETLCYANVFQLFEEQMKPTAITRKVFLDATGPSRISIPSTATSFAVQA